MSTTPDLTIRETAALSGVSRTMVEKAVQSGIISTLSGPARLRGGAMRYLPIQAVVYFHALRVANLTDLPKRHKRSIWTRVVKLERLRLCAIEFTPGTTLDLVRLSAGTLRHAERYRQARDQFIASHPDILGGTPVIDGTRIPVYAVLDRLQDGDTLQDLIDDYPEVPPEAFEAAELYAKAHPLRGRPSGRPWRNVA